MAGAGYKLYTTGDVLSASDVNTYLQQQTVMVFASAAARTSALASVLAEGMVTYLKDTDVVEIYTGAAWVSLDDPNAIQNTLLTAKGAIVTATGASTPSALLVGTNGQVLTADSTTPTGLKYATPANSGGMTLITTTTWDNTVGTYTYSSLGSYKHLLFIGQGLEHSSIAASAEWRMRFNSDVSSIYGTSLMQLNGTVASGAAQYGQANNAQLSIPAGSMLAPTSSASYFLGHCAIEIPDYGSANFKSAYWRGGSTSDGTPCFTNGRATWGSTSAITSVTLYMASGNFKSGTMRLYGVS